MKRGSKVTTSDHMHIVPRVLQGLMLIWTAICIAYHLLLFLISVGTTDFDGNPYGPDDYVVVALLLTTVIIQMVMLPMLVRKISNKVVLVLIGSVSLPWLASSLVYRDASSLFAPIIYAVPMILLYGGYWFMSRASLARKQKSP